MDANHERIVSTEDAVFLAIACDEFSASFNSQIIFTLGVEFLGWTYDHSAVAC